MVDNGAKERCVYPTLCVYRKFAMNPSTIPKKLVGIDSNVVEAGVKGKMPAVVTDIKGWKFNVLKPTLVATGM